MSNGNPSMTGQWESVPPFPLGLTVRLKLQEVQHNNIEGAGTVEASGEPLAPVEVVPPSRNDYPQVTLTISRPTVGNVTFKGSFSGPDTVCGQYESYGKGCIRRV
jgi:hypothetical protein